ncbi:hypothetical protein BJ508DRAFT_329348 [Ascobolus immersus RN42]|uniref:Uncharacterized protein n=1 Tax=Ascobolus immersus RN42 TaxID=1160509 RepID=A0A3N4HX20_ASCIM|nr:hypothetical protein BJ508DRAFT_329348 [Ascobolus immersus RN42]
MVNLRSQASPRSSSYQTSRPVIQNTVSSSNKENAIPSARGKRQGVQSGAVSKGGTGKAQREGGRARKGNNKSRMQARVPLSDATNESLNHSTENHSHASNKSTISSTPQIIRHPPSNNRPNLSPENLEAMVWAIADANPWMAPHGTVEKTWEAVLLRLQEKAPSPSQFHGRRPRFLKEKIDALIAAHNPTGGDPEELRLKANVSSEVQIRLASVIERCSFLKDEAETAKTQKISRKEKTLQDSASIAQSILHSATTKAFVTSQRRLEFAGLQSTTPTTSPPPPDPVLPAQSCPPSTIPDRLNSIPRRRSQLNSPDDLAVLFRLITAERQQQQSQQMSAVLEAIQKLDKTIETGLTRICGILAEGLGVVTQTE